jgi:hypothetical protein
MGWSESQDRKKPYFEFNHVGPGDYILVYNNDDRIDPDDPYPRTFYPGVPDVSRAKSIHLVAGQEVPDADISVSGGRPTRELTVTLTTDSGDLPDIEYVDATGEDGSVPSNDEVSAGVYKLSLFMDVRYEVHGEGYCSAMSKEAKTGSIEVDGSDMRTLQITLIFSGGGCGGVMETY